MQHFLHSSQKLPRQINQSITQTECPVINMPHSKLHSKSTVTDEDHLFYMDGGADTCNCAESVWRHESFSGRHVNVADYEKNGTVREEVPIGTSITAVDLPDRTVLIRCHEATQMDDANSLARTFQLREADCIVEDRAQGRPIHRSGWHGFASASQGSIASSADQKTH